MVNSCLLHFRSIDLVSQSTVIEELEKNLAELEKNLAELRKTVQVLH